MFERYDVDDLFLAFIDVLYPEPSCVEEWEANIGGLFYSSTIGYGYWTILHRENEKYFDLSDLVMIDEVRRPQSTSRMINYIEPLSNYYTQDGTRKKYLSKRAALYEAKKYYGLVEQKKSSKELLDQESLLMENHQTISR